MYTLQRYHSFIINIIFNYFYPQGSWEETVKTRLKNMRRAPRSGVTGMKFQPPSRKENESHHLWAKADSGIVDELTYTRHKQVYS